jgi:hypothetical protein
LNFNQSFEKWVWRYRVMSQRGFVPRTAIVGQSTPLLVRLMGKFVLEVLPAATASVIGGLLLTHYELARPSAAGPVVESSAPASAEMVRLVREEHAMIHDFLLAQSAAEKRQVATADVADASAAEEAELAAAALRRTALASAKPVALPPPPARGRATVVAATAEAAPQGPLVIAQPIEVTAPSASPFAPPAPIAPPAPPVAGDYPSLVATTLAIPGHVVGAALHAVSVIGGIPSWIGNRLGSTPS